MIKVNLTYEGQTITIGVPEEELKKLFPKKKKTGYERVEDRNTPYWSIGNLVGAEWHVDDSRSNYDDEVYENANYYSDKTVAENMARAQRLWYKIHRRAVELCEPVYLNNEGKIYTICFANVKNKIDIYADSWVVRHFGEIYFDTEEHCQQVINEFHDELLWYFTQFKDRADM